MKNFFFIAIVYMFSLAGCYVQEPVQDARYANPPAQGDGETSAYEQETDDPNGEVPPPAPGSSENEGDGPVDPGPRW